MSVVVARLGRIIPARIAHAVVDGVMPVIIMIGVLSVPTAVVWLECVMGPTLARVSAGYRDSLSPEPQCPHVRRMRVSDPRLNRRRCLGLR